MKKESATDVYGQGFDDMCKACGADPRVVGAAMAAYMVKLGQRAGQRSTQMTAPTPAPHHPNTMLLRERAFESPTYNPDRTDHPGAAVNYGYPVTDTPGKALGAFVANLTAPVNPWGESTNYYKDIVGPRYGNVPANFISDIGTGLASAPAVNPVTKPPVAAPAADPAASVQNAGAPAAKPVLPQETQQDAVARMNQAAPAKTQNIPIDPAMQAQNTAARPPAPPKATIANTERQAPMGAAPRAPGQTDTVQAGGRGGAQRIQKDYGAGPAGVYSRPPGEAQGTDITPQSRTAEPPTTSPGMFPDGSQSAPGMLPKDQMNVYRQQKNTEADRLFEQGAGVSPQVANQKGYAQPRPSAPAKIQQPTVPQSMANTARPGQRGSLTGGAGQI